MTLGKLELLGQVRDLQIVDRDDHDCGIVDDLEFEGEAGKTLRETSILVGPGAYRGRLPGWAMSLVKLIAGDRLVRVPWEQVKRIDAVVQLAGSTESYGLGTADDKARKLLPSIGGIDAAQ